MLNGTEKKRDRFPTASAVRQILRKEGSGGGNIKYTQVSTCHDLLKFEFKFEENFYSDIVVDPVER